MLFRQNSAQDDPQDASAKYNYEGDQAYVVRIHA
jgi:hypothetical protein